MKKTTKISGFVCNRIQKKSANFNFCLVRKAGLDSYKSQVNNVQWDCSLKLIEKK